MTLKKLLASLEGEPKAKLEAALEKKEESRQKYKRMQLNYGFAKLAVRRVLKEIEINPDHQYAKLVKSSIRNVEVKFDVVDVYISKYRYYDKHLTHRLKPYLSKSKIESKALAEITDLISRFAGGLSSYAGDASHHFRISQKYFKDTLIYLKCFHSQLKFEAMMAQRAADERKGILDGSRVFYYGLIGHIQVDD